MTHPSVNSIVERLEPCPFCGPGNSIVECYQGDYGYWKVGCGACGSHSGIRPKSDPDGRAKVVAHWNTRPAATIISELQAEIEQLQRSLLFWMPGVDMRLDEATREFAAKDALLLAGYTGPLDVPCWGDGMIDRALTAESSLSRIKAETIEECARVADDFGYSEVGEIASAIRSLGSTGGGDAEEGSTQKEGSR